MYILVYICMYICMYVCMYGCMHVCMYACMHVYMYVNNVYIYIHKYIYIYVHYMYICVCIFTIYEPVTVLSTMFRPDFAGTWWLAGVFGGPTHGGTWSMYTRWSTLYLQGPYGRNIASFTQRTFYRPYRTSNAWPYMHIRSYIYSYPCTVLAYTNT